ncbi:NAD(P)-dependent alcohol dehydrogenase [Brevibacterium daeguense]|uniref:NAD(P)-dependent alcohol dehydrogenase n=2 Tax=Brevibacterium daeguense TaxID=909936 RepID=A0ABP8EIE7_9MICO
MNAIVQTRYGGPEALVRAEVPVPAPGPGEVIVRVVAAGLDAGLVHLLEGRPRPVRWAMPLRGTRVLGSDFSGTIHALGPDVSGLAVGQQVFGTAQMGAGSLAEYARARVDKLAPKPAGLSHEEAAAVPVSATTALRAVRDAAQVQAGQRVLILGVAGGVGHFAAQLAVGRGSEVTGACSTAKVALAERLGIARAIDYTRSDPLSAGPFDAIIDTGGHRSLQDLRRALGEHGTLVLVGSEPEGDPLGGLGRGLRAALLNPLSRQKLVTLLSTEHRDALRDLTAEIDADRLRPVIDRVFPLAETADAVRRLGRGKGTAKTVIRVAPNS